MARIQPEYRFGRIVWAWLRPSKPGPKQQHPAIIISPDSEIIQPESIDPRRDLTRDNAVAVLGVSTRYRDYAGLAHFVLPSHPNRHAVTKLTRDCAAVIGWYDLVVIPDEVDDIAGDVPSKLLTEIEAAVRADLVKKLGAGLTGLGEAISRLSASTPPSTSRGGSKHRP